MITVQDTHILKIIDNHGGECSADEILDELSQVLIKSLEELKNNRFIEMDDMYETITLTAKGVRLCLLEKQ